MTGSTTTGLLGGSDPTEVGPYRLRGRLGAGGMGTVYLGLDASGRQVAVKLIRPDLARRPEFRERLKLEADSARRVARFCTAAVLDVDITGDIPYLVTEFVDGPTLADSVRLRGPLSHAELHQLAASMATALMAVHRAGIVHRDLKPSNIVLSRLGPKVIDFGIARALDAASVLSREQPVGTPAFMAPEQARGESVTPAADVFAWGGVLVYAATGRYPFGAGPPAALLFRVVNDTPVLDGFEDSLRPLVEEAMRKDPALRPTAEQLYARLLDLRLTEAEPPVGPPLAELTALVEPVTPRTPGPPAAPPSPEPAPTPVTILSPHQPAAPEKNLTTLPTVISPAVTARAERHRGAGTGTPPSGPNSDGLRRPHGRRGIVVLAAVVCTVLAAVLLVVLPRGGKPPTADGPGQVAARALRLQIQDRPLARRLTLAAYRAAPESTSTRAAMISLFATDAGPLPVPASGRVLTAALRPDGRLLAAGTDGGTIELWDLTDPASPSHVRTIANIGDWVYSVAFSPDGKVLAGGIGDGRVRLWDVAGPARASTLATVTVHRDRVRSVAFAPGGDLLAAGGDDGQIVLWRVSDPAHPQQLWLADGATAGIRTVAFSPNGQTFAFGGNDGTVRLWNAADPAHPAAGPTLRGGGGGGSGGSGGGGGGTVESVAFSPAGSALAAGAIDGSVHLWRLGPAGPVDLGSTPGGLGGVTSVAFGADGNLLVSAGEDSTVRVTDVSAPASPVPLIDLRGHTKAVNEVLFTPGARTVVSASGDGSIRLWTIDPGVLARDACADAANRITQREWQEYFGSRPYGPPCS
ncbi:WD domain, G-beta repeat-containing protein [Frankia sp. EI5c]|uniref:WD40 repeat domain-containing serine/threonine protein kinase n=1 Tax=Frankia sp. EI5c TaxID=683316 RepID=UPI0007C3B743|nr:serine/threonine-protein kinase [Frankia sp. EI5c]OAA21781.1 WD domain, G-beta repeat-containing protein [Frankia sp. EI5c]